MRPVTYKTNITDGVRVMETVELTGYPTGTPGLLVSRAYGECQTDGAEEWLVVHARTGLAFPFCWTSPEAALSYAVRVADVGDWQGGHDATERIVKAARHRLSRRAYDLGGRQHYVGYVGDGLIDNGVIA